MLNREIVEAYSLDDDELGVADQARAARSWTGAASPTAASDRPCRWPGKTAIIVDDGAATGTTMKVAIRALRRRSPREIIVALPVSPPDTVAELSQEADRVVCLSQPGRFLALGYHYRSFPQLTDEEVTAALDEARRRRAAALRTGRSKASGTDSQ